MPAGATLSETRSDAHKRAWLAPLTDWPMISDTDLPSMLVQQPAKVASSASESALRARLDSNRIFCWCR